MGLFKRIKTRKTLAITICSAALGFLAYCQLSALNPVEIHSHRPSRAPSYNTIKGFSYSASHEGNLVLQISADLFDIHKKKIGRLRFGFLNEAVFSNAHIRLFDIYQGEVTTTPKVDHAVSPSTQLERGESEAPAAPYTFDHAFRMGLIPSLKNKRIVAVKFKPIRLELFIKGEKHLSVKAEKAALNLKTSEIEFRGNVQWESFSKAIRTHRLVADLSKSELLCPGEFVFDGQSNLEHGRGLRADFFLRQAKVEDRHGQQDFAKNYGDGR